MAGDAFDLLGVKMLHDEILAMVKDLDSNNDGVGAPCALREMVEEGAWG